VIGGVLAACAAGCGSAGGFRLSGNDNDTAALDRALAQRRLPDPPAPVNTAGTPRVFAVTGGPVRAIVAFDLAAGKALWTADADVQSRIAVGGDFLVALEGPALVGRDQAHGARRWSVAVAGTFVGAAADRERAYLVTRRGETAMLAAYDGASGHELWKADAAGVLGAPAAHGGVIYVPFLSQWLAIVDGKTGAQLTRLRGIDEEISVLRATSTVAYFGSKQGVFRLDHRSASGTRGGASYRRVAIPPELERTSYGRDAYDAAQVTYTAADRARVLWSSVPTAEGPLRLDGDGYAIHYFRFVFGFDAGGALRWAYSHPRVELVASEDTGRAILCVSASGELIALDRRTGAAAPQVALVTTRPVIGATFDADGWAPALPVAAPNPATTAEALMRIARDRDARFDRVKQLAVRALAALPGPEVTRALLAVLSDERAPDALKDSVTALVVARRDPASLPVLVEALGVPRDHLAGTEPAALGAVATAIAGLGSLALDPAEVTRALAALQRHLEAPTTPTPDLVQVIAAMAAIGQGAERAALCAHLRLYHADDDLGADPSWQQAIVRALDGTDAAVRDALQLVAGDPRTARGLAARVTAALGR
jgi:putative pyrroloquinoline-quinone binding quinoprotein